MKAIIYVFSGTDNTRKVSKLFKAEFEKNEIQTDLYDVTNDYTDIPNPNDYDYVIFSYPIHAFNAPAIMQDFAKKLPDLENKKYFIIKTSGEPLKLNNSSSNVLVRILKKKCYSLVGEYHYIMPYNMVFRHTDSEALKMYETATKLIPIETKEIISFTEHKLPQLQVWGRFVSFVLRIEHSFANSNGLVFTVNKKKCVMCGKCAKECPVKNITIDENGKFHFSNKCILCTKCSFNCPTDAFTIGMLNPWRINGPYPIDPTKAKPDFKHHHSWYCKKSYKRYYEKANEKINKEREL
ncbi:MAG: EFR1 family ferrodoxin [Clostridia bacterium]|nr:EFR1 family ferrodoxin [Clostridia bacterium]